jgi:uncharacterized membrane protein SirB2
VSEHLTLWYPALLHTHRALVGVSVLLFVARAAGVALLLAWPMKPAVRWASVLVDTTLMGAGVTLWALMQHNPRHEPWLAWKLLFLLVYIVLGSYGLKRGATRASRAGFSVLALLVVSQMYGMARWRDPWGLLHLLVRP